jgi:hypothetical protein
MLYTRRSKSKLERNWVTSAMGWTFAPTWASIRRKLTQTNNRFKLQNQNKMNAIKLNRILYVYALNGVIKCLSADEIQETELLAAGWKHTATIDPALWIEAMANGHQEPCDMLDELQFSPANYKPTDR